MKVDGGLSIVAGPMGAGKSLFEVRHGVAHMLALGWWVTNIPLYGYGPLEGHEDALWRVAFHVCPASRRNRRRVYDKLRRRYVYTEDLEHALRHAVPRTERRPGVALARLGWDESYSDLNSREWNGGRGKGADDRANLFERVPMLRKNGVAGFLLVQHPELIDKNARRVCNWYVQLQNQRESQRVWGIKLPLPALFLAYWYQANRADKADRSARATKTERYFLTWHRRLYDTLGLYGVSREDAETGKVIWLGEHGAVALPGPPRNEAGPSAPPQRPTLPAIPEGAL